MSTLRDRVIQRRRLDKVIAETENKLASLKVQANVITADMASEMSLGERQCVRIGGELLLIERSARLPNFVDISPLALVQ